MKLTKKKHPSMVHSDALLTRLMDQEDDLMAMKPASPKEQPPKADDEEGPKRQGPSVPALHMKKMALGGEVDAPHGIDEIKPDKGFGKIIIMKAEGGEVSDEEHASLAAAIMARRHKMAEGGEVDIEANAEEQPNAFDKRNAAVLKENYDEDMMDMSQPMDSNEHSDDIEKDKNDKVAAIRSRMISRRIAGMK